MPTSRIAVVQGAPGAVVDELLSAAVERWSPQLRIAGVVAEGDGLAKGKCSAGNLRTLASNKLFSIFAQDNPDAGIDACNVDGRGAVGAAEVAEQDIAMGCDLVVLNRYAKLEQAGEGLCRAFAAAIRAGVPLLTSVSPQPDGRLHGLRRHQLHAPPARRGGDRCLGRRGPLTRRRRSAKSQKRRLCL